MSEAKDLMLETTVADLARHAPFDRMDHEALAFLARRLRLAYFARGKTILSPGQGVARALCIVQKGEVRGELADAPGQDIVEYSDGDCFPVAAVTGGRPSSHVYVAVTDTFCYEVDAEVVTELVQRSEPFRAFCNGRVNVLLQRSFSALRSLYAERSSGGQAVDMKLGELVRGPALCCRPTDTLQSALKAMHARGVGSIIVTSADGVPLGIFTERDLLRCAAMGTLALQAGVETVMTPSPASLPATATAAEAAVRMVAAGIRHIVVVEEGRLVGVVSERDLFALQRTSMRSIISAIEAATGLPALVQAAADVRALAGNLLVQGLGAGQLTQLVTSLNDKLASRIIALEAARHDLAGITWCWISLGSEGRQEQTLCTDQDNALIFSGDLSPQAIRERLLPFAGAVNTMLDACGFPLCKGGIMAGNPKWCMSAEEWQERFANWLRDPLPEALLNAAIFFDFRALYGDLQLAHALRSWLTGTVKGDERLLRAMARNALESRPPLGLIADFQTGGAGVAGMLDLKSQGTRIFVDAARVLALASGIAHTGTAERLRACADQQRIPRVEAEAMIEAFQFILLARFRLSPAGTNVEERHNRIDPATLNELDRRILKETFRQARKLQTRLALDYQL